MRGWRRTTDRAITATQVHMFRLCPPRWKVREPHILFDVVAFVFSYSLEAHRCLSAYRRSGYIMLRAIVELLAGIDPLRAPHFFFILCRAVGILVPKTSIRLQGQARRLFGARSRSFPYDPPSRRYPRNGITKHGRGSSTWLCISSSARYGLSANAQQH